MFLYSIIILLYRSYIVSNFLFSLGIYLSSQIFSSSFATVSELFCSEVLETLVIFKSPVASAVFWIALFEGVLGGSVGDCVSWWRIFGLY